MTSPNDMLRMLPEHLNNPFIAGLPPLMTESEAIAALSEKPHFEVGERQYQNQLRRACIMRLNRHYFRPIARHFTLESRVANLLREGYDGRNISDGSYLRQLHDNHERVVQRNILACANPAPSTASALTLLGCSGMGKTETTSRILRLYPQVINHEKPYSFQQVVWLKLECPHMGSARQLCLDFFSAMDSLLGENYFRRYQRSNLDLLSTQMGRVAAQHGLGLLVIDELQNLVNIESYESQKRHRSGNHDREKLLNFLLTLINKIGVPMLLVGTLAAAPLLKDTLRIARRASGFGSLVWERLERKEGWDYFVKDLWQFQWTRNPTELSQEIIDCMYEETQGILDLAVKLFMLAQLFAIQLSELEQDKYGSELLSVKLFQRVAREEFKLIEPMLIALKRGDREAIARYDDIRPFHDHIEELFTKTIFNRNGREDRVAQLRVPDLQATTTTAREQTQQALINLGISQDIIDIVLAKACSQVDSSDPVALMEAVLSQMRMPTPSSELNEHDVPLKPALRMPRKKTDLHREDVRKIVAEGKSLGKDAHQALKEAGLIAPADYLYRVS